MKREELLIEPDELATLLDDPALRLFDTTVVFDTSRGTGRDRYDRGHIPGAAFLDHASLSVKAPGLMYTLPDEDTLARQIGELGIGNDDIVDAQGAAGQAAGDREALVDVPVGTAVAVGGLEEDGLFVKMADGTDVHENFCTMSSLVNT